MFTQMRGMDLMDLNDAGGELRTFESLTLRLRGTTEQLQRVCSQYVRDRTEMALIQKAVLEGELS